MNNLQKNLSAALVCSFQNTLCFSASPKHKCLPGCPHLLPQHLVSGQKGTQLHNQLLIVQKITHSAQRSEKEGINGQTASKYPNSCFLVAFINEGLTICFLKIWKNTVFNNCKKKTLSSSYALFPCSSLSLQETQDPTRNAKLPGSASKIVSRPSEIHR